MKAVILAAGEGLRLHPITLTRPKVLIKIGTKPILEHCLVAVKAAGIDEAVIVVHYMADAIRQYFGDGRDIGMKIQYVEQNEVLGTGDALIAAKSYLKKDFLLVYGDLLFAPDTLKKVITFHNQAKPAATLAVVQVKKPEDYGIVKLKDDKHVERIIEKPDRWNAPRIMANAGIYVLSNRIFQKLQGISVSERGEREITDALNLWLNEESVLAVFLSQDEWLDVGRPWDLLEANRLILARLDHKIDGIVEAGVQLKEPVTVKPSAQLLSGAYIEGPTLIEENSKIGPNCYVRPSTYIGRNVRIGNACEIKNSIIMDNVHIGHLSYVGDSIIGENCNLGAGTVVANYRFDAQSVKMKVKNALLDSDRQKLGVVLGDHVKVGVNALFMPGVKIGRNSWIGPNVVISRDVPSYTQLILKQNLETKEISL